MAYSVDLAYSEFYKSAAIGSYNSSLLEDRLLVTGMGAATAAAGVFRSLGRVIHLVNESAKVIFYAVASLGCNGNVSRFKDHCKLLALNIPALVAQPLQVVVNSIAIAVGVISPSAAYRMMQAVSSIMGVITSAENEIWQKYDTPEIYEKITSAIKSKLKSICEDHSLLELMLIVMLYEFHDALESALIAPLGLMKKFHLFGANPKELTAEQKKLTPILFLNGSRSHQATFLPLLHALEKSGNKRPIYSFTLYNSDSPSVVIDKVREIQKQYPLENQPVTIDMVGHSMGTRFIQMVLKSEDKTFKVDRVITIGMPFWETKLIPEQQLKVFDLIGKRDLVIEAPSRLDKDHHIEIDTGHLGLLFHPQSLEKIKDYLGR